MWLDPNERSTGVIRIAHLWFGSALPRASPRESVRGAGECQVCHRGKSISAQAASHKVLTVTRMLLQAGFTGGQSQKLPLP